jgi:hypothetical protein
MKDMRIVAIEKANRPIYKDLIWQGCKLIEVKDAPILGFYDIIFEDGVTIRRFEAEIRNTNDNIPYIGWEDEMAEFLIAKQVKY